MAFDFNSGNDYTAWNPQQQASVQPIPQVQNIIPQPTKIKGANGRTKVVFLRYLVIGLVLTLAIVGVAQTIIPKPKTSSSEIISTVRQDLQITSFPTRKAEGLVLAYVDTFLTIGADSKSRDNELAQYGASDEEGLSGLKANEVIAGPYITGVASNSDTDATFSVIAKTSALGWVNLGVPVAYSPQAGAFSIIGTPTLMPTPAKFEEYEIDDKALGTENSELEDSVTSVLTPFFEAWGKSDVDALKTMTIPGTTNPRAYVGFNSLVQAGKPRDVKVYQSGSVYMVRVSIPWVFEGKDKSKDSSEDEEDSLLESSKTETTWVGTYLVQMTLKGEDWKVLDIMTNSHFNTKDTRKAQ